MIVVGTAIYSNTLKVGFIWDDFTVIVSNEAIRKWWDLQTIWNAFNSRFILGFTLALNYAVGKFDVTGYHVFNITAHILSASMLYFMVRFIFETPAMKKSALTNHADLISLFSALLFLVHPVQTTAVNYIWQRAAVLATFFYLASVVFYLKARITSRRRYFIPAFAATIIGMFTKEFTATIPIVLVVCEFLFFGPVWRETLKRVLILLPFLLSLAVIPVTFMRSNAITMDLMRPDAVRAEKSVTTAVSAKRLDITRWVSNETMTRKAYYLTQLNVIRTYLRLLFFPVNQNLDHDYPISHNFKDPSILLSFFLLSIIFLIAVGISGRHPSISFGIFWFFIGLSVESLVVQKDVIFEHRLYLLTAGFAVFFTSGICLILNHRRNIIIVLCLVTGIFSISAYRRNMIWEDPITLWKDVIKKSPHKAPGYNFAALAYGEKRDFENAIACYKKAIEIKPDFDAATINLGTAYAGSGKHQDAIQCYLKAVEINPDAESTISAYNNLGIEYCAIGKSDEAEKSFKKAVETAARIDPKQAEPAINLGMLYYALKRREEAKALFEKALVIDPDNKKARRELANIY